MQIGGGVPDISIVLHRVWGVWGVWEVPGWLACWLAGWLVGCRIYDIIISNQIAQETEEQQPDMSTKGEFLFK